MSSSNLVLESQISSLNAPVAARIGTRAIHDAGPPIEGHRAFGDLHRPIRILLGRRHRKPLARLDLQRRLTDPERLLFARHSGYWPGASIARQAEKGVERLLQAFSVILPRARQGAHPQLRIRLSFSKHDALY